MRILSGAWANAVMPPRYTSDPRAGQLAALRGEEHRGHSRRAPPHAAVAHRRLDRSYARAMRISPRAAAIPAIAGSLASLGCAATTRDTASADLSALPPNQVVLVGKVRVFKDGYEQTSRTAIETTGGHGGFQVPASGDVVFVVDRPLGGAPVRLKWLSTLEYFLELAHGPVLARGEALQPCAYFGTVIVRIYERRQEAEQAPVRISFPGGWLSQRHEGEAAFKQLVQAHPNLAGLRCDAVIPRVTLQAE